MQGYERVEKILYALCSAPQEIWLTYAARNILHHQRVGRQRCDVVISTSHIHENGR
jgi:hypothetical protein